MSHPDGKLHLKVIAVNQEVEPKFNELLSVYASDSSQFIGEDIGPFGHYGSHPKSSTWQEPNAHVFLVEINDECVGFVHVSYDQHSAQTRSAMTISEMFLVKHYRNKGVEHEIARHLFALFPNRSWHINEAMSGTEDGIIWTEVIKGHTQE